VSNWTAAEILLAAAVLVLAMPREDGFILPERRDWLGWLRRLRPRVRRQREDDAGREADQYVTDLRADRDQDPMTVRQDQLPSAHRRFASPLVTDPTPGQKPPWKTAENPAWDVPAQVIPPEKRRRRAPGDPPTIVIEIMRPAMDGDLRRYLEKLPSYPDLDESGDVFFVPRSSLAPGVPGGNEAPQTAGDGEAGREQGGDPGS
jgi:hypothetical protein